MIELPFDPTVPILVKHPEKIKSVCQRGACTLIFIVALFTYMWSLKKLNSEKQNRKVWELGSCVVKGQKILL